MIDGLRPIDHHVLARHADIDTNTTQLALVMVPMRRLHHDGAANDAIMEALELRRLLVDALLDGWGGSMFRKLICRGIGIALRFLV